jgi:hypothetical protein
MRRASPYRMLARCRVQNFFLQDPLDGRRSQKGSAKRFSRGKGIGNFADEGFGALSVRLELFRKISTFRGDSCFSIWLHRISVNVVLMHLRRKRPAEVLIESLDDGGADSADRDHPARADTL